MDELVNQVSQRTGLPPDQARQAVDAVLGFLKDKLPGPIASQIDGLLGGQSGQGGQASPGNIAGQAQQELGGLGNMLGGGGSNS
jgi:hypothetical protein